MSDDYRIFDNDYFDSVKEDESLHGFLDLAINQKAREDFKYLCNHTNFLVKNNVNNYTLSKGQKVVGDFFPIGYNVKDKAVRFPESYLDVNNEKLRVAVVCYEGNDVKDVLVFKASDFKHTGLFSMFKYLDKAKQYGVILGDLSNKKLKQNSFGVALSEYSE